ncbi:NfrA family protein [Caulobacter mirabilis]|nr:tetratricopeptide repeat protein [Caulobacter mirabilis]
MTRRNRIPASALMSRQPKMIAALHQTMTLPRILAAPVAATLLLAAPTLTAAQTDPQAQATAAYAHMQRGDYAAAATAAERAVAGAPDNADWRLLLVDAYLRTDRPADALAAIQPLANRSDYPVQSRLAQAAAAAGRKDLALEAYAKAAAGAPDAESRAFLTRSHIAALVEAKRLVEARAAFDAAKANGALEGSAPLDLANLALAVGDDATAHEAFAQANTAKPLSGSSALDAAYNARRLGRDADAVRYFRQGLDSAQRGEITLDEQRSFAIRREVETLERRWGASALISRGVAAAAPGAALGADQRGVVQAGGEVYYRLGGYRSGRPIDVFARAFQTLDAETGDATGGKTTQGWIGVRWKPIAETNLILEGSRMVALGDLARDDWMVRAAWSADQGVDLRMDRTSWPTWRVYADLAHIVDADQTIGLLEGRAGRSFRIGERSVLTPYAVVRADYDNGLSNKDAIGAGAGLAWRHWFRETPYTAPASFIELSLDYRARLSGDDRAEGTFVTFSLSY